MGVQGLTTFVEGNRSFLPDVRFRDSPLVIDGCSLYFRLYFNHGLDQQHGGDYDAFASLLTQFFSALAACNIQPYVVLDGGIDPSEKKFPTLRQRLQSKIKEADKISRGYNGSILPILARDVFIQVLIQRGVPLVQCKAEADWEIACLAHQWKCPVLTNDSDFYVFDLPGGCLPIRFFQWTNLNGKVSQRYISARLYNTKNLCSWFGGMNCDLIPLCAVLLGNDYSAPKETDTLLALIDMGALGRGGGRGKGTASSTRINILLLWLSSFSNVAEALQEVSGLIDGDGGRGKRGPKSGLSSQLWAAMQEYQIGTPSSLAHWFSGGRVATRGKTSGLAELPECLSLAEAQGQLASLVVNALVMQRVLLIPQVENSKLPSSHFSSTPIRQAIYGLLLQNAQRGGGAHVANRTQVQGTGGGEKRGGRGCRGRGQCHTSAAQHRVNDPLSRENAASMQAQSSPVFVEEYDRLDINLKKNQVVAQLPRTFIHLDGLNQAPEALRLGVLLEVLAVKESALAPVPVHLQLAVAVTGFWSQEAVPRPSQPLVQALVLNMVYGEVSWNSQPGATHHHHAAQLNWAAEQYVLSALDRQRVRPGERRGLDIRVAHSFSQWQSCLWSALCLNQLLLMPLPQPYLSGLFSGTLVHGLHSFLKAGRPAESLLRGGSLSWQLYSCLLDAVRDCSFKANPSSLASGRKRRGRGRGRRGRDGREAWAADELNNMFTLLMCEEEYDDW
ncbi:protein asteroid homolog 1 [Nematolebias whitei]|uniref:protein asteroid homolog 1 n=1 Tax=Nematolebias whitei TaxID=451745 RepID=UPI00189BC93D|nr:protein asteroid homolog 1 [Nematolebias whitei]